MAELLAEAEGVEILNDVVLNQVLVRFGDDEERTNAVVERVQRDGTCWVGASRWHGKAVMRVSIVGWQTTTADIERSAAAIIAAGG
jgi:threonine aldolase